MARKQYQGIGQPACKIGCCGRTHVVKLGNQGVAGGAFSVKKQVAPGTALDHCSVGKGGPRVGGRRKVDFGQFKGPCTKEHRRIEYAVAHVGNHKFDGVGNSANNPCPCLKYVGEALQGNNASTARIGVVVGRMRHIIGVGY